METFGRDLSQELFGGGTALAPPDWRQQLNLDRLETQHGLPPGVMTAVIQAESNGDPRAVSPVGARGLFQFMPDTARAYKIDPNDPQQAAPAAAKELASLYKKYNGDLDKTLAGWNWGQGRVDKFGLAKMPTETRGFLATVKRFLGPGTAEAAAGRDLSQELFGAAPAPGRDLSQELFGAGPAGRALAAPADLSGDSTYAAETIQAMRQRQAYPEPPSNLTIDIEKSSTPQAPAPWPGGRNPYLPPGVPSIEEETLSEGITRPSTMIPLLAGGAGARAAAGMLPQAGGLLARGARAVGEGVTQALGWGTGSTIETGQLPSPGALGTEAAIGTVAGGALETLSVGTRAILRRSRAGKAIAGADEATEALQQEWRHAAQTAQQAHQQGQAEVYERALAKATQAQGEYQAARLRREDLIAANQREYDFAVRGQGQAIQRARQIPGQYQPGTPSWTLYEKFGDAAKDATVDLAPAQAALTELRTTRGVLPDGTVRPFPQAVESIASSLEHAAGTANVTTIRAELRRLGPLTRSADGNVRGPAKQLYGIYADAMEASPIANDLDPQEGRCDTTP